MTTGSSPPTSAVVNDPFVARALSGAHAGPSVLEDRVDLFMMVLGVAVPTTRQRRRPDQRHAEAQPQTFVTQRCHRDSLSGVGVVGLM